MGKFIIAAAIASGLTGAPAAGQTPAAVSQLAAAPGIRVSADFMTGAWSDREDCRQAIEFRRDGQFLNPDGSRGSWRLEGDVLTFTGSRVITVRLVPRSRNETIVVQADGTLGYSRRCPTPATRP